MKAKLIYRNKIMVRDFRLICEMVIWQLPLKTKERPHGLKYRLHCGKDDGTCLVRYDNEHGKGDHRHYGDLEEDYNFSTVEKLMSDFLEDVSKIQQGKRYEEKIELTSNES